MRRVVVTGLGIVPPHIGWRLSSARRVAGARRSAAAREPGCAGREGLGAGSGRRGCAVAGYSAFDESHVIKHILWGMWLAL